MASLDADVGLDVSVYYNLIYYISITTIPIKNRQPQRKALPVLVFVRDTGAPDATKEPFDRVSGQTTPLTIEPMV